MKMGRKAVMFSKTLNQGSKRYMAVTGGKRPQVIASSDSRKGLADLLKKKKSTTYYVLENPKVRGVTVTGKLPPKSERKRGMWSRYIIF